MGAKVQIKIGKAIIKEKLPYAKITLMTLVKRKCSTFNRIPTQENEKTLQEKILSANQMIIGYGVRESIDVLDLYPYFDFSSSHYKKDSVHLNRSGYQILFKTVTDYLDSVKQTNKQKV